MADLATITNDLLTEQNKILQISIEGTATQQAKDAEQDAERKVYDNQVLAALTSISEAIKGMSPFKIKDKDSSSWLGSILKALGLIGVGAAGLAAGLLIGWTTFVANLLADLGKLVGKGIKKLSPQWLKDFIKAFTKEGKLYKNTMKFIDDFKAPKWFDNMIKAFTKEGTLYKNTMKFIDDFKAPKWFDNMIKAFTKEGKLYKNTMKFIDDFKAPKWFDNLIKAFGKEGTLYKNTMKFIDDFKAPKWFDNMIKAFGKDGKIATKVMKIIDDFKMPKLTFITKIVDFFNPKTAVWIQDITKAIDGVMDLLPKGTGGGTIGKMFKSIGDFFKPLGKIGDTLGKVLKPIKALLGSGKEGTGILKSLSFLMKGGIMGRVFRAFAAVGKAIAAPLTIIMGIVDGFFESKDAISKSEGMMATMVNAVVGAIGGFIDGAIFQLLDLLKSGISWIAGFFGFDEVEKFLDSFSFSKMFNKFLDGIYDFVNAMFKWETYVKLFDDAVSYITGTGKGSLLGSIKALMSGISDWFMGLFDFSSMSGVIASTINVLFMPYTILYDLVTGIWNWFGELFGFDMSDTDKAGEKATSAGGIGGMLVNLVAGVWDWFMNLFGWGTDKEPKKDTDTSTGVLGFLKGLVTGVWTWFKSLFDFSSISGAFASVLNVIFMPYTILTGLVEGIWNWFAGLFGFDTISTSDADSDVTTAGGIGGVLVKLVSGVWDWFKGLFGFGAEKQPAEQEEGGILSYLTGMVTGIWTWFKDLFANPVAGLVTLLATLAGGYLTILDFITAPLKLGIAWILRLFGWDEAAENTEKFSFKTTIMAAFNAAVKWVTDLFSWSTEPVKEGDSFIVKTVKGVVKTVKEWFGSMFKFDSTSDIIKSIINVLTWLPNLVTKGVTAITAWFLDLLGFKKESKAVADAGKEFNFGDMIMKAVKAVGEWFGDLFDIDIDSLGKSILGDKLYGWLFGGGAEAKEALAAAGLKQGITDFGAWDVDIDDLKESMEGKSKEQIKMMMKSFGSLASMGQIEENLLPEMKEVFKSALAEAPEGQTGGIVEEAGFAKIHKDELIMTAQSAKVWLKAAQILTGSRAIEQAKMGGGPPVIVNNNNIDASQTNSSSQATTFRMPESVRSGEPTMAAVTTALAH